MATIVNPFRPIFDAHSKVLILGTMPSPKSRENGFYYGHPQNRFWRVLAEIFGEGIPQENERKRAFLLKQRIALYDVLSACEITGASDASIAHPVPNDLVPILKAAEIRAIFATGQKAGVLYRKYCEEKTGRPIIVLPSPSPANCAMSIERLAGEYRRILEFLR